jgi:uncharacterized protein
MVFRSEPSAAMSPAARPIQPSASPWRVAIVGSGVAGLGAAWRLKQARADVHVTVFEADARLGGHANTVRVTLPDAQGAAVSHGVDTGFLVYNERTYPRLIAMFAELGVATAPSDMSFSVQAPRLNGRSGKLEWSGSNLSTVFAQRRNLLSVPFWQMLAQLLRFNRLATQLAQGQNLEATNEPLGDFLHRHGFTQAFKDGYLLPMIACIWSCPVDQMLRFPVGTLVRFCDNHGLIQVRNRPRWFTVQGGSTHYVQRIAQQAIDQVHLNCPVQGLTRDSHQVTVHSKLGSQRFDALILACHAPQALALLGEHASADERATLSAFRTQANIAVLHTDTSVMPGRRRAWAAWNYERASSGTPDKSHAPAAQPVCLHYWINALQPLPFAQDVIVSLNPIREPSAAKTLQRIPYAHPIFDAAAVQAQQRLPALQGVHRTWFAGAWCGYGFHEDGLRAGQTAADGVVALAGETATRARPSSTPPSRLPLQVVGS